LKSTNASIAFHGANKQVDAFTSLRRDQLFLCLRALAASVERHKPMENNQSADISLGSGLKKHMSISHLPHPTDSEWILPNLLAGGKVADEQASDSSR
jgi:hypothetical protein